MYYLRGCRVIGQDPTVEEYFETMFQPDIRSYSCTVNILLPYSFSLHLFRAGVRKNNSAAIRCALDQFAPLFFGMHMPFYMETYIRDSFVRLQCPPELFEFIQNNESYSISGDETKGEGGDFILEAFNRRTKMFMGPGLPTERRWSTVCRNIDDLKQVIRVLFYFKQIFNKYLINTIQEECDFWKHPLSWYFRKTKRLPPGKRDNKISFLIAAPLSYKKYHDNGHAPRNHTLRIPPKMNCPYPPPPHHTIDNCSAQLF